MKRQRAAARLFAFLTKNGIVARQVAATQPEIPELAAFRVWLKRHRGAIDKTIEHHASEAERWVQDLLPGPVAWTAIGVSVPFPGFGTDDGDGSALFPPLSDSLRQMSARNPACRAIGGAAAPVQSAKIGR